MSVAPLIPGGQHQMENWSSEVLEGIFSFLFMIPLRDADGGGNRNKICEGRCAQLSLAWSYGTCAFKTYIEKQFKIILSDHFLHFYPFPDFSLNLGSIWGADITQPRLIAPISCVWTPNGLPHTCKHPWTRQIPRFSPSCGNPGLTGSSLGGPCQPVGLSVPPGTVRILLPDAVEISTLATGKLVGL